MKILYLRRLNHKDQLSFNNYQTLLKRRGKQDTYLTSVEDLAGYFKDLEVELKKDVTLKIVRGKVKFEEHKALNKALYEEKLSEVGDGAKLRETGDERNYRLGRTKSKSTIGVDIMKTKAMNKAVKVDRSLFKVVQTNPKLFKSASISLSRKKMRKLAGIDNNEHLLMENLTSNQVENLERVIADRYTSEEIKSIYNVCLNYKKMVNDPKRKEVNFSKTKEMIFKSIDHFEGLLDKPEKPRSQYLVKRHRSTGSLRAG
jgi:hypothetical protein